MAAHPSRGHAYARASARGVLLGLFISVCLIAPFAIGAAEPDASPTPTNPPASQPTSQLPIEPTPTSAPTAAPSPTATGTAQPTDAPTPMASPAGTPSPIPDETSPTTIDFLVTFISSAEFAGRATTFAALGVVEVRSIPALRLASVSAPAASAALTASALRAAGGVLRVEAEVERTIEATPDDTLFADQWALPRIGWTDAYGGASPASTATVAILDTGIDGSHPDLAGLLVPGAAFAGDAAPDTDRNGHGTQMAGIVAAHANNATGVAGVAFAGVRLMPVTVLDRDGTGADADIIAGIIWAVENGADVVLMSFSSPTYSPSLQAAIDYAWSRDVVLVAATGNDASATVTYPAGDRGVIGVSNTDQGDALNSSSNYGDDTFLAAPGTAIITTTPGDSYVEISGTSASAAMVAGAAGLLRAFDPATSNGQVVYRLAVTAADVAPVEQVGNGRLNLVAALSQTGTDWVQPAGAGVFGDGGPIVEPYIAAACVWTGATSTAWETGSNWSGCTGPGGIPSSSDAASIGSTSNAPLISSASGTVAAYDITIAAGVTVSQTGGTLQVGRNFANSGTFDGTGGTVQFTGTAGSGTYATGTNQFFNIVVDAGVDPKFDQASNSQILVRGDFTNNNTGLDNSANANFTFNGSSAQIITSASTSGKTTFGSLTIDAGSTVSLASNIEVIANLTVAAGTLDTAGYSLSRETSGGTFSVSSGAMVRVGGTGNLPWNWATNTLNAASTVEYYGTAQSVWPVVYGNLTLTGGNTKSSGGTFTAAGTFTLDTSTTFSAGAGTHNYNGNFVNNGTYSAGTGTANFGGAASQTVAGSTVPTTFNNLTINKSSSSLVLSQNVSVAGNLTVTAGILDLDVYTANRTAAGGTLSVAAGATLRIGGTGDFPTNYTTNTLNVTSTVEYSGTTQTIASLTYGNLTLSGSATKTPAAGLTINGDFTIGANTTFAAGSLTHIFAGHFTNNGTFSPGTSTAVFSDTAGGTIGGTTQTTFATISITTGVMTLNTSATATALTFENNNVANSFSHASGVDLTVNGNVTINQASGGGVAHSWNVNAGSATVTGSVTFSVTANNSGRVARVALTTGTLTVQGDVIMNNALLAANSIIDMSGGAGTLNLGGALTVNTLGTLTPGTTSTVVYNGTGAQTVTLTSAVTYSTLKIDKASGTATLGAAVTTSNATNITIQQGTLDAGGFNIAMAGTWTNNGGTFSGGFTTVTFTGASATITGSGSTGFPAISIATGATVAMNNSNSADSLTFVAGNVATSLTQANGTTFTVNGAVTMNQPTGSVASAWNINAATATVSGLITFAGTNTTAARVSKIVITTGTLNANGGITFAASVAASKVIDMSGGAGTLNLKGALTVPALSSTLTAGTSSSTFVYADTSAQTINFFSAGAYHNLSVSNSSAGGATLSAAITASNVTGNLRVLAGGKLDNGGFAIAGNAAKTIEVQDDASLRLGGTTAFPTGFSTVTLGGASNNSTIDFYGGAQSVAATATLGTNYDNVILSGTAVTKTLLGTMTADRLLTVNSSATFTLANFSASVGSLTGSGTIQTGSGAVVNTLTIGSDGTSTTFSGAFNSINDAADIITKTGAGTLTLSGTSTFTGTLKASAGTINVTGTLAATSTLSPDAGTISGNGTAGVLSSTAGGGTVSPGNPASSTGILNTGNTTLNSSSSYTVALNGTTAGTGYDQLSVTGTASLGSAALSLSLGYSPTVGDSYTIIANDSTDAVTGTFNGQAQGSTVVVSGVSMTVSYTGGTGNDVTLTVASITNTWTGALSSAWSTPGNWQDNRAPSSGHVLIFPSGATSFTPNNDIAVGTTFAAIAVTGSGYTISGNSITLGANGLTASYPSGSSTISLAIALPADRTFTISNSPATLTLDGAVSGAFTLAKAGSGTLVLNAGNTYSATTISAGTLQVGNGSTTGTLGSGSVSNSGTLVFNRSNALTVNNAISGTGTVTQSGVGTLTVGGANSYSGATTVSAGTLIVNGSQSSSAVILSGGTVGGSGTVGPITSTVLGGSIAPGSTGPAILNGGNLNLSAAGTRSIVVELNGTTAGSGYDQVNVTGTVNLTGATLSGSVGFAPVGGDAFTIVNNDGADAVTGTFSGLAEGASIVLGAYTFSVSYVGGTGNDVVLTKLGFLAGNVFEDVNYGGGAGRTKAASTGVGRSGVRVELYTSGGVYLTFTTTDANGDYRFSNVTAGTYYIRVVNSSVSSSRTGYTTSALAVQTYRTDAGSGTPVAVTDFVGGTNPAAADPGDGSAGATFSTTTFVYSAVLTGTAQSVTKVVNSTADITGIDFGFNFDTVVNVNNTGQGTLRQFVTNANLLNNAGLAQSGRTAAIDNAIWMISNGTAAGGLRSANNYFSGGVATITPSPALPAITDPVVLDAQTQPGWASVPIVQLSGTSAGAGARGFDISAGGSTVRGLVINTFNGNANSAAIWIATNGGNTIQGNYLGTNAAGSAASANYQGIYVNNTTANVIGGSTAAQRNVLSGNTWRGIMLDNGASGNTVRGNYIGLDATGTSAIANNLGISIWSSPNNTIGGTGAGEGNTISGNTQMGIYLVFSGASGNTIQGNTVGLNAARSAAVANGAQGIEICCAGNGGSNNTIGGTAAGAANVISGNTGKGVRILGGTGNGILTNAIYGNGSIGIELGTDGVTANNGTKDGAKPNSDMDFPVFTSAVLDGTTLYVTGYVGSAPSQALFASSRVEVFKSDKDGSGNGEGQAYLGYVTADASGNVSGTITGVTGLAVGDSITGTASDTSNSTSEFSANVVVAAPAYVSSSGWGTSANAGRYISVAFPAYLPAGATVNGATFSHTYRSYRAVGTTCYYIEVYAGALLIGTHGGNSSPISCQTGSSYQADQVSLPEVNTAARANSLSIRLIVWNSSGAQSEHSLAKLGVDYHLD